MKGLSRVTGYPRLYRRNATYYHRATVLKDILDTYGKSEEAFSLGTKDCLEAIRNVRVEATELMKNLIGMGDPFKFSRNLWQPNFLPKP